MTKVEGGGGPIDRPPLPPTSRLRVTTFSSRLLGLTKMLYYSSDFYAELFFIDIYECKTSHKFVHWSAFTCYTENTRC